MSRDTTNPRAKYERLRAAHLTAVRVALGAHVARVEWPRERQSAPRVSRIYSPLSRGLDFCNAGPDCFSSRCAAPQVGSCPCRAVLI